MEIEYLLSLNQLYVYFSIFSPHNTHITETQHNLYRYHI